LTGLALLAVVLMVAALASGLVERAPISFPMIFLGAQLPAWRTGTRHRQYRSAQRGTGSDRHPRPELRPLFDAVNLRLGEIGRDWIVPVLSLGPGTVLTMLLIAGAAALVIGMPLVQSLLLRAVLPSVDPVVLRDVVRDERVPRAIRRALQTEAGTNDIVVLPLILILATIALGRVGGPGDWLLLLGRLFVLGPLVGVAIGAGRSG
jgi:hypothetical protein